MNEQLQDFIIFQFLIKEARVYFHVRQYVYYGVRVKFHFIDGVISSHLTLILYDQDDFLNVEILPHKF